MILAKRPDIERFLAKPEGVRVVLIYGRDTGVVKDRGAQLASKIVPNLDDPFDVALLTDGDLDAVERACNRQRVEKLATRVAA